MADVEDLRSASDEEEEESEDEYAYESEASTVPVADAGDQLDVDVARCCARFGDESAERSTTKGSRTLIVTLKIDPTRSQASAETRQAGGLTAPLSAKIVFSGGATQYASGYCDAGIAVTLSAQLVYEFAAPDEALPSARSDGSSAGRLVAPCTRLPPAP